MVPIDASTAGRRPIERSPRRASLELRQSSKLIFVVMYVITSEYESYSNTHSGVK